MRFNDGLDEGHRPCSGCGGLYDTHSLEQFCYCSQACPCGDGRAPITTYEAHSACSTACLLEEGRCRRARAADAMARLRGAQAGVEL